LLSAGLALVMTSEGMLSRAIYVAGTQQRYLMDPANETLFTAIDSVPGAQNIKCKALGRVNNELVTSARR
jgi:hypothetical protein